MQIGVETSRAVESKRIFVVDDDEIARAVLQFMLQDDNETHDLPTLANAFAKGEPDLLIAGPSVYDSTPPSAIAQHWPKARFLLIASSHQDPAVQAWLNAGVHGVIAEPFTVEGVRQKVDLQLGRTRPAMIQLLPLDV